MGTIAPPRFLADQAFTVVAPSPIPAMGTNLYAFLLQRFATSWGPNGLNCAALLGMPCPVVPSFNMGGIAQGGSVTTVGNLIPASAFAAGGQFTAAPGIANASSGTSMAVVIGLAAALGVVVLVDLVLLIWYCMSTRTSSDFCGLACCSGGGSMSRARAHSTNKNPIYSNDAGISTPTSGAYNNYPINPVRSSTPQDRHQWV